MALGIGAGVENLITKVSLVGVQETERNQKLVGAGFRALKGDIAGAKAEMQSLGVAGSMITTGIGVGMTAGALAFGREVINTTIRLDSLTAGLEAMTGSAAEAKRQLREIKEAAKSPGLGYMEAIQGSIALQSAGLSAELAVDSLKEFGNALASVGRGKEDLDGVTRALTQIMGKGKVSAEEINQIAERVPQIRGIMKDAFGTANTEELQKMGISSDQFITQIVNSMKKLPRAARNLTNDLGNLNDEWQLFLGNTGSGSKSGLSGAISLGTKALGTFNMLNDATDGLAGNAVAVGVALVGISGVIVATKPAVDLLSAAWLKVAGSANLATAAQAKAASAGLGAGASAGAIKGAGMMGKIGSVLPVLVKGIAVYEGLKFAGGFGVNKLQKNLQANPSQSNRAAYGFGLAANHIGAGAAAGWSQAGPVGAVVGAVIGTVDSFRDFYKRKAENEAFWNDKNKQAEPTGGSAESPMLKYLKRIADNSDKMLIGGGSRSANAYNSGDVQRALFNALNAQVV
jgi:tape measure domain-containing protein